jgi:hypothetical protein
VITSVGHLFYCIWQQSKKIHHDFNIVANKGMTCLELGASEEHINHYMHASLIFSMYASKLPLRIKHVPFFRSILPNKMFYTQALQKRHCWNKLVLTSSSFSLQPTLTEDVANIHRILIKATSCFYPIRITSTFI